MPIVFPFYKIIRSEIIIYELEVYTYNSRSKRYPVEIDTFQIGRYSSLENAEKEIKKLIEPCPENQDEDYEVIHSFAIQELGIDVPLRDAFYDERIYEGHGKFYGVCNNYMEEFSGRSPKDYRFKETGLVEFRTADTLEIGIVLGVPLTSDWVSRKNAAYQKLFNEGNRLKDLEGKLQAHSLACDQSDNTYRILYGKDNSIDIDLPEPYLFPPKFPISARMRRGLGTKYRYETGVHTSYLRIGESNKYGLELNNYMLDSIKEPHAVLFDCYCHLVISLESYKILKGNPEKFDKGEIKKIIKLIKANQEDLRSGFREMVEKWENDKACSV
jgi:hypothetical protein